LIVVDASVAVKWTVLESGRDKALELLDHADELIAPDLLLPEVANVLRRKSRLGEVGLEQAEEALRAVQSAILHFVPSLELVDDAFVLSRTLDHSVYDCFYLACALPAAKLVTADEKFVTKCQASGFGSSVASSVDASVGHRHRPAASVDIDPLKIRTIERLSARMEGTFEHLRASAPTAQESGRFQFVSSEAYRAGFDSPAYLRLASEIEALSDEELGILLALGWLGRSYHRAEEWPLLLASAVKMIAEGRNAYRRYFIAQMPNVARGFAKLQTRDPHRLAD